MNKTMQHGSGLVRLLIALAVIGSVVAWYMGKGGSLEKKEEQARDAAEKFEKQMEERVDDLNDKLKAVGE